MKAPKDITASGVKSSIEESVSYFPPQKPARLSPIKQVKNQQPIVSERNLLGASFDTSDKPIGERHSSDNVIVKYAKTSHNGDNLVLKPKMPAIINST